MSRPTIGRTVHFHQPAGGGYSQRVLPAIITRVHSDTHVTLAVVDDATDTVVSIERMVALSDAPGGWSWPALV